MPDPTCDDLLECISKLRSEITECLGDLDAGLDSDQITRRESSRVGRGLLDAVTDFGAKATPLIQRYGVH